MTKLTASLSLDLDNKWAYLRTHGVAGWDSYPSYLDVVVPRALRCFAAHNLRVTCFVVGRDAQLRRNADALAAVAAAGNEIGNHSLNHYPWMHTLSQTEVAAEIVGAEECIERATGYRPVGFRGPGYSLSPAALAVLAERGYLYDASSLPTFIGPLARWYFRHTASREAAEQAERRELLGVFRDGLRPVKPHLRTTTSGPLLEIPVTTFPLLKLPIHMTYLVYLWQYSPRLTKLYLRLALAACRWLGVGPSMLLHPLDFLGVEDDPDLRFFPGMNLPWSEKLALLEQLLVRLTGHFDLVPMCDHAESLRAQFGVGRPLGWPAAAEPEPLGAACDSA